MKQDRICPHFASFINLYVFSQCFSKSLSGSSYNLRDRGRGIERARERKGNRESEREEGGEAHRERKSYKVLTAPQVQR